MRFRGLDLNLLIALDILLNERTVTAAADRLHLSQSALSGALARLRQHFGDDLVVSSGRRLIATPLAESMRASLRDAIINIETVVTSKGEFDPVDSRRTFRIEIPDYLAPVLLTKLATTVAIEAPHVVLDIKLPSGDPAPSLLKGELDLVITPEFYGDPRFVCEVFIVESHALIGWSENPSLQTQPSREDFFAMRQVVVRFDRKRLIGLPEQEIEIFGGGDRTAMIAPSYSSVAASVVGTDRVAITQRRLAEAVARNLPIAIWEVPVHMTDFRDVFMFHPLRERDKGLLWLRDLLTRAASALIGQ